MKSRTFSQTLRRAARALVLSVGYAMLLLKDVTVKDVRLFFSHAHLFLGAMLLAWGLLSFSSDRYCDGAAAANYICTRPATYYFYPPLAQFAVLAGLVLVLLWALRRTRR